MKKINVDELEEMKTKVFFQKQSSVEKNTGVYDI